MAIFDNTIDILLADGAELQEQDGDFFVGDCSNRYIEYLVSSHLGHYKESPLVGIGINSYLNSNGNRQVIKRDIIDQLNKDIFTNPDVDLSDFPSSIRINKVIVEK